MFLLLQRSINSAAFRDKIWSGFIFFHESYCDAQFKSLELCFLVNIRSPLLVMGCRYFTKLQHRSQIMYCLVLSRFALSVLDL